jgi:general transcription factor 3C polypeptide 5 (transcription factor C subunit 1)
LRPVTGCDGKSNSDWARRRLVRVIAGAEKIAANCTRRSPVQIPKKVNWEEYIPQGSDQWESQMVVSRMFDEKPIWSKTSLTERLLEKGLSFSFGMLRRFLCRIAYYFSSGPFLRFWIKKGYDPRKDPDSRIYQRIDYRVPHPLRDTHSAIK